MYLHDIINYNFSIWHFFLQKLHFEVYKRTPIIYLYRESFNSVSPLHPIFNEIMKVRRTVVIKLTNVLRTNLPIMTGDRGN